MRSSLKFVFTPSQERLEEDFPLAAITLPKSQLDYSTTLMALSCHHAALLHEGEKNETPDEQNLLEFSQNGSCLGLVFLYYSGTLNVRTHQGLYSQHMAPEHSPANRWIKWSSEEPVLHRRVFYSGDRIVKDVQRC